MIKQIFKDYIRRAVIEFLNGGPIEESEQVVDDELADAIMEKMKGPSEMGIVQHLQVEEALQTLPMQLPIYITGAIDDKMFQEVMAKLNDILFLRKRVKELQSKYPDDKMLKLVDLEKPIKIIITTPGGLARESLAIYDTIQSLKEDGAIVETVGMGKVMSAGTLLLSAGTAGHRKITKNTTIMIHDIAGGFFGKAPEMQNQWNETQRLREQFFELFRINTNMSKQELEAMLDKHVDQYLNVEQSLKYGIIDKVI